MKSNFKFRLGLRSVTGLLVVAAGTGGAWPLARASEPETAWSTRVSVETHSVAQGLPVLALDRDDWHKLITIGPDMARATQRVGAFWEVEHPSGWRLGAVARSQASVVASPGALALAQAGAGDTVDAQFDLSASYLGWRGRGLTLGLPWQSLDKGAWTWTADVQWLQLTDLRHTQLGGVAQYQAASQTYGFDVTADRASRGITGPFLGGSDVTGTGYSVSWAAKGRISPGLTVSLKAEDVWSRLRWGRLARERLHLNTQVVRRRADGFLDYAPAISGQQSVQALSARMGARGDARLVWQYAPTSTVSARWHRLAGMDEFWLGWSTAWPDSSLGLQLGWETVRQAAAAKLTWHGFYVDMGSDGRGTLSEYRQVGLGWTKRF